MLLKDSHLCFFNPSASTLNIWKKDFNKKVVTKQKFNTLYPLCMYVYLAWILAASSSAWAFHSFSAASRSDCASANFSRTSVTWFMSPVRSAAKLSMAVVNSPRTALRTSSLSASNLAMPWKNQNKTENPFSLKDDKYKSHNEQNLVRTRNLCEEPKEGTQLRNPKKEPK